MEQNRRPIWRRAASRARRASHRLLTVLDRLTRRERDPLLPPAHLRIYYYRTWNPEAFRRACDDARAELLSHGLRPEHRLLDVGSGIGNCAVGLLDYLQDRYDGLDTHLEAVSWCQQAITARHPRFRFQYADVRSQAYNPSGRDPAESYRFPFADREFDFVFLGSVFTHMMPDGVEHYLREIARVLRPGGVCLASYFLLNDDVRPAVEADRSFMTFRHPHPSGACRLHDARVPEAAVALEERFVREVHARVGLRVGDVRRGRWWSGETNDQDVVTSGREG